MFSWDPFDSTDGAEARLKSFRIYWGVTATTSGIITIAVLFFIADDLEDGWFKTLILCLRPRWSVFRKRKNAQEKRQDSMRKEGGENSEAIAHTSVGGVSLRGGSLNDTFLRTRRQQDLVSIV
jgi:hypothetical protein